MVCFREIKGMEIFREDDNRVADEEVGEVGGEEGIHAAVHEVLFYIWIDYEIWVEVFFAKAGIVRDVG